MKEWLLPVRSGRRSRKDLLITVVIEAGFGRIGDH
jgi:hypothetical protein